MEFLIQQGVEWILMIQSLGAWLAGPMRFFSFLGSEEFFLLAMPVFYWSVSTDLGIRMGLILLTNTSINHILKVAMIGPRPYWVSPRVQPMAAETSFGVPSAHSQTAAGVWGICAAYLGKTWAWIVAGLIVFLIGFSRMYLGMHFLHDVLLGWLLGGLSVWAFSAYWDRVAGWLKTQSFVRQIGLAFVISMILIGVSALTVAARSSFVIPDEWLVNSARDGGEGIDPVSLSGAITPAATLFGLAIGLAWMTRRGGFQSTGPFTQRSLRYIVGVVGILILWYGLGAIFPRGEFFLSYLLRFFRYTLVGFWVSGGAPWLFIKLNLSQDASPRGASVIIPHT